MLWFADYQFHFSISQQMHLLLLFLLQGRSTILGAQIISHVFCKPLIWKSTSILLCWLCYWLLFCHLLPKRSSSRTGSKCWGLVTLWWTPGGAFWRALRSYRKSVQERHRKSDGLQDKKNIFFVFTISKRRSVAFQPCITLGGVRGVKLVK